MAVLFLLVSLVLAGLIVHARFVGLPVFIQAPIVSSIKKRGFEVKFERARLRGLNRWVIDNLRVSSATATSGPEFTVRSADLRLSWRSLLRLQFLPQAVTVNQASLAWPVLSSNRPPQAFSFQIARCELGILQDHLELKQFRGSFRGAQIEGAAAIAHPSALRSWIAPDPARPRSVAFEELLYELAEFLEFEPPSKLRFHFEGDGTDPSGWRAEIKMESPSARTPWGEVDRFQLSSTWAPASRENLNGLVTVKLGRFSHSPDHSLTEGGVAARVSWKPGSHVRDGQLAAEWNCSMARIETPWAEARSIELAGDTSQSAPAFFLSKITGQIEHLTTPWSQSSNNALAAELEHSPFYRVLNADWNGSSQAVVSEWGQSGPIEFSGRVARPVPPEATRSDAGWSWWGHLEPFQIDWTGRILQVDSPELEIENLVVSGQWRAPRVQIHTLQASLADGHVEASAQLDVSTRLAQAQARFDFDVHQISSLFPPNSRRWLGQFDWETPPLVQAQARAFLPDWTNASPDWREEVLPTLELSGDFTSEGGGAFRGFPVLSAHSRFTLTNLVWRLPNLTVHRPEGSALLQYTGDMRNQDFHWEIDSRIDPTALKPAVAEAFREIFDWFEFFEPPLAQGHVSGNWGKPEQTAFAGRIQAGSFSMRGERLDQFSAGLRFSDLQLTATNIFARKGSQFVEAGRADYSFTDHLLYLTNTLSTFQPSRVTRVIGPRVHEALAPFRFHLPPTVRIEGIIPTRDLAQANVRFEIMARAFSYWQFNVPQIRGSVRWLGETVSISPLHADFYNGRLQWSGKFDFSPADRAEFSFDGRIIDADLALLLGDLLSGTNQVRGLVNGSFAINGANTANPATWQGRGDIIVTDGFLWSIPIFGLVSPMLNTISPGLGQSPISSGAAHFTIDRAAIHTSDLELHSPFLRLHYYGSAYFDGTVQARMEAEILRDAWIFGRFLSFLLRPVSKAFEYEITGAINEPHSEPVYIPKTLLRFLQPVRTLKKVFGRPHRPPALLPNQQQSR